MNSHRFPVVKSYALSISLNDNPFAAPIENSNTRVAVTHNIPILRKSLLLEHLSLGSNTKPITYIITQSITPLTGKDIFSPNEGINNFSLIPPFIIAYGIMQSHIKNDLSNNLIFMYPAIFIYKSKNNEK